MTNIISYLSTILLCSIDYGRIRWKQSDQIEQWAREAVQEMRLIIRVSLEIKIDHKKGDIPMKKISGKVSCGAK